MSYDIWITAKRDVSVAELNISYNQSKFLHEAFDKASEKFNQPELAETGLTGFKGKNAGEVIQILEFCVEYLGTVQSNYDHWIPSRETAGTGLKALLDACKENPDGIIGMWY